MKKLYFLLLSLVISLQSFAQIQCYVGDPINILFGATPQIPLLEQEYIFIPQTNGELTICGTNCMSPIIQSTCFQPLDPISAQSCFCSGAPASSLTFSLQAFVPYSIYFQPLGCSIDPGCPSVTFTIPSDDPCLTDAQLIGCGFSDNGFVGQNNFNATIYDFASSSDCLDNGAGDQLPFDFNGPDHVYQLMLPEDPMQNESYFISLEELGSDLDLFLYVCENEALFYCFQSSIGPEGVPNDELIIFDFNYSEWQSPQVFIIVDSKDQFGGGGYQLSVTCQPDDCSQEALPIMCGETLSNQDTGAPTEENTVDLSNYTSCYDGINPYDGNDIVYELVIEEEQQFKVVIEMLNGTDADVFLMDSCALGEPTCVMSSTEDNSGGITTEIIDMHLTEGTYYIVVEEHTPGTAAQFDISISCECSCIEDYNNPPSGQLFVCENFENMEEGLVTPQSTRWHLWENDQPVSSPSAEIEVEISNNFLFVERDADIIPNVIYDLENQTSGRYRISWNMWIEEGFNGFFSVLHEAPNVAGDNAIKAYEVNFFSSGLGNVYRGDEASGFIAFNTFNFQINYWNTIVNIIDIDQNQVELWINNELIGRWDFDITDQGDPSNQLAGINFVAETNNKYRVDNICMWKAGDCEPGMGDPGICMPTGQQFTDESAASCNLYTPAEWELCFSICDKGGRYISRGEIVTDSIQDSDYVPLQCLTDDCVLDSYGGSLPDLPLYTDSYIFYDDEFGDSLFFTQPSSLDLVIQNNVNNFTNPKFFLYTCDCENAEDPETCEQTCQGELGIGSFFDFDFSGTGFYYILAIGTEDTNYSFALRSSPSSSGDPCNQSLTLGTEFEVIKDNTSFMTSVEFGSQNLDTFNDGDYLSCTDETSGRTYLGKEVIYALDVLESTYLTCVLDADADMGIFLYNFSCGVNCIRASENEDDGGEARIDSFLVDPGTYYLVVDKDSLVSSQPDNFSLDVIFDPAVSEYSIQFNLDDNLPGGSCNTVPTSIHEVLINKFGLPIAPDPQTEVLFYKIDSNNELRYVTDSLWNFPVGPYMPFNLEEDNLNNPECAYIMGDDLGVYLTFSSAGEGGYCSISYGPPDDPNVDPGIYAPGNLSFINGLSLESLDHYAISPTALQVQASGVTDKPLLVTSSGAAWETEEVPDAPWLQLTPDNANGTRLISIDVEPHESQFPRSTVVRFKYTKTDETPVYRTMPIVQSGKCFPAEIKFTTDKTSICEGCPLTIKASPLDETLSSQAYTFSWSTGATDSVIVIPEPQNGMVLTVTMTDRFCPRSDTKSFVINDVKPLPPNPVGIGNPSACLGDDTMIVLEVVEQDAGTTFLWYEDEDGATPIFEGTQYEVAANLYDTPGEYAFYVEALSADLCFSEDRTEVLLTIYELPDVAINMDDDVLACVNSTVTLQALASNGQPSYDFVWDNGLTTSQRILNPPLTNESYAVTVTDGRGCMAVDEITVDTLPSPLIIALVQDENCGGSNGMIEVEGQGSSAPYSFLWDNGETDNVRNELSAGIYALTITDANMCSSEHQISVNEIPGPDVTLSTDPEMPICPGDTIQITATASGPNNSFSYKWVNNLGSEATISVTPIENTTYSVTITDGNTCTSIGEIEVQVNDLPEINITGDLEICLGESTDLTATMAGEDAFSCSWEGLSAECTQTLSPPENTTYFVTLTNDNTSCKAITDVYLVVNENPTVFTEVTPTNCEESTGTAIALPMGGEGDYTYTWNNSETTATISNLGVGIFNVTITDANTCSATAEAVIIEAEAPTIAVVDGTLQDAICGEDNGSITVEASGGATPYSYTWDNGDNGATINDLAPGTYTVTVTDASMCSAVTQATIEAITVPSVSVSADVSICIGDEILLTATASGGIGDIEYMWSNDSGVGPEINVSPSENTTYTVTVTDNNNCIATDEVEVTVNALPEISITGDLEICMGESTDLTASIVGEDAFSCSWEDLSAQCTQTLSPQENTTYFVTLVNDNTSCRATTDVYVVVNENPTVSTEVNPTNCEESTGTATALPMGGEGDYTYTWSNSETTATISNLEVGTFNVTITDANTCSATAEAIITEAEAPTIATVDGALQDATCGENNGSITVEASGGTTPYNYAWDNGDSGATISELAPGTYTVTVTDASMCSAVTQATIEAITVPSVSVSADVSICIGDEILLTATASGGIGDIEYMWSNDSGVGPEINVSPSENTTYTVTVTDGNNCIATDEVEVTVNALPEISITGDLEICLGESTDLTANIIGEDAFSCSWEGLNTDCVQTLSPLENTTYFITLTNDNTSCRATTDVYVVVNENPTVSTEVTTTDCNGSTGMAIALPMGGEGLYTYIWDNGGTTQTISNLSVGIFNVTVTDENLCTANAEAIIIEAEAPIIAVIDEALQDATCEEDNGSITVEVSGGAAPYNYAWDNGDSGATISDLAPGTYIVTVTDASTCSAVTQATVEATPVPTISVNPDTSICIGDALVLTAIGSGGIGDLDYQWSDDLGTDAEIEVSPTDNVTYTVMVTDDNACTATDEVNITVNALPEISIMGDLEICLGESTDLTASIVGDDAFSCSWEGLNADCIQTLSPLENTTYFVTLTNDNTSCNATTDIYVVVNENPTVSTEVTATDCNDSTGIAMALPMGGEGAYSYMWDNGATTQIISNLSVGIFNVTVTDENLCAASAEAIITEFEAPMVAVVDEALQDATCREANGSITVEANGGAMPYNYNWNNGGSGTTINNLEPGIYIVTVTDANMCSVVTQATIEDTPVPSVSINSDSSICIGEELQIMAMGIGGIGGLGYMWNDELGTNQTITVSPTEDATYIVTVTDENDCIATDEITIVVNDFPVVAIDGNLEICSGGSTQITLSGFEMEEFSCDWGTLGTECTQELTPLEDATYTVNVTDVNTSCQTQVDVNIIVNERPVASMPDPQEPGCAGGAYNLNLMVMEGSSPYSYSWNEGLDAVMNPVVILDESTTYIVTVTDENGCSAVAQSFITVFDPIEIDFQNIPQALCVESEILLDPSIDGNWSTIEWTISEGGSLSNASTLNPILTIAEDAPSQVTLSLTGDGPVCPEVTESTSISIVSLPEVISVDTLCTADLQTYTVLLGTDADSISSNFGFVQLLPDNRFEISAIDSGQNIVVTLVNSLLGCESMVEIIAPECNCQLSTPEFVSNETSCDYEAPPILTVIPPSGLLVNWYDNDGNLVAENTNGTYQPAEAGTYFTQSYDSLSTCLSEALTAVDWEIISSPEVDIEGFDELCMGDTLYLAAEITGSYDSVMWSTGEINLTEIAVIPQQNPSIYTATAYNETCMNTDTFEVSLFEPDDWGITVFGEILCNGDESVDLVLENEDGNTPNSVVWNTGSTAFFLSDQGAGTYEATFVDENECTLVVETTITGPAELTIDIVPDTSVVTIGDTIVVLNDTLCFNINGGTPNYIINLIQGTPDGAITNTMTDVSPGLVKFTDLADECYFIEVIDINECIVLQESVKIIITDVEEKLSTERYWSVYPNPTTGQVFVQVNSDHIQAYDIAVTDVLGRVVYQKGDNRNDIIDLDLSSSSAGVYLIHLNVNGEVFTKKLVIQ